MTRTMNLSVALMRVRLSGIAVAAIGGAACLAGQQFRPRQFYPAYLTALIYWLGISLGCLAIALVHGLTGGLWGRTIRRVVEAGFETLPLLAILFLPIWLGTENIYEWANSSAVLHNGPAGWKRGYLNTHAFQFRAIVYFAVWIAISRSLIPAAPVSASADPAVRLAQLQRISGLGLIAYGFTFTLAAVDWVMSLEPKWYSTMYGLIHIAGHAVSGLSFATVAIAFLRSFEPWSRTVTPTRLNDVANLLLTAVMFWAYCAFFQFLVIWSGNLPVEIAWHIRRSQLGWQYWAICLGTLHFALPFLLLLSQDVKRRVIPLSLVAALLLVMRYVDLYWIIVPGFQHLHGIHRGLVAHALDLTAFAAIGGAWLSVFAWRLSRRNEALLDELESTEISHESAGCEII